MRISYACGGVNMHMAYVTVHITCWHQKIFWLGALHGVNDDGTKAHRKKTHQVCVYWQQTELTSNNIFFFKCIKWSTAELLMVWSYQIQYKFHKGKL